MVERVHVVARVLLHQAAEAKEALERLERTKVRRALEQDEVEVVAHLETAVGEGLRAAIAREEQVARLLLDPHALNALEGDDRALVALDLRRELEDEAEHLGHVLVVELLSRLPVDDVGLDALEEHEELVALGVFLLILRLDAARHAHALAALEEVVARDADAVRIREHVLDGLVDRTLEVVLVADLPEAVVDEAALEEALVDQRVLAGCRSRLLDPTVIEGIRGVLRVDQRVDSDVVRHTCLGDDVQGVYQQLLILAILAHACSLSLFASNEYTARSRKLRASVRLRKAWGQANNIGRNTPQSPDAYLCHA